MRLVETIPGMGGEEIKEKDVVWVQVWCIARTFVNATMYPQHNDKKKLTPQNPKLIRKTKRRKKNYSKNMTWKIKHDTPLTLL
jgi:hypothetical protein